MNGILEITLNGKKERLHFNNYAKDELRRFFIPKDKAYITQGELMKAIIDKWQENEHALLKMLVYAGILGDSLAGKYFNSRLSPEYIGEYIGTAPADDLIKVWKEFLDAQGFELTPEEKGEEEPEELTPEEEKKKKKIT